MSLVTLKRHAILGLLLLPALAACGVKGPIEVPKGQEDVYTYPLTYPDPATVVPGTATAAPELPPVAIQTFGSERKTTTVIQNK